MHYQIIIITDLLINKTIFENYDCLIINHQNVSFIKKNHNCCYIDNQEYKFDYLISSFDWQFEYLKDEQIIITNQYLQTTIENIFIIGPLNNSYLDINLQLWKILDFLNNL